MEIKIRRDIEGGMPFDRSFDDGFTLCHATGDEVLFEGDEDSPESWWIEYEDPFTGEMHYGR